jgi:serine/threonine-protein kinase
MNLQDLTGRTLGQYELRELLGMGGMGAVYRGYQASLKREVAVKVITPQAAQQPDYVQRFTREAEIAATLEHSHIVPIYDYGTQQQISYVVMRLLTGGSLDDRFRHRDHTGRALPSFGETAQVIRQVAGALDYAHGKGVIHRDVKPSNVMFDQQGSAYLVDFGIAKLLYSTVSLTGTGVAMGTPLYMSPEQWRAEDLTPAADQYALGVMAYALVTGQPPFDAPTPFALMHKHLNETPIPAQRVRPDLPPALGAVLARVLAKAPADRFPTSSAFAESFDQAVRERSGPPTGFFVTPLAIKRPTAYTNVIGSGSISSAQPRSTLLGVRGRWAERRSLWVGLITLLAVILVGGAVALLSGRGKDQSPGGAPPSNTPEPPTATHAVVVILPSGTPAEPTVTSTAPPTETASPTLTATLTPTPTASPTATATLTATQTPDIEASAVALMHARLTQTAAGWTDTPTPDLDATVQALALAALTGTAASWTDTPTPSATPSATLTRTLTLTPTPTPTITPSRTPSYTPTSKPDDGIPPECASFLTPRLRVGQQACVSDVEPNNVRAAPESLEIYGQIPPGAIFDVLDGPECTMGTRTVWWYVSYNGIVGWTAEGSLRTRTYWLAPLPCPVSGQTGSSYGDLIPNLGGTVREITEAGAYLNARAAPSTSAAVVDQLEWGDRVLWNGRTVDGDGHTWFEVQVYSGQQAYIVNTAEYSVERDPAQTTPGITIGATIRITTEGDDTHMLVQARIRDNQQVANLRTGDRLTVIGGPVYADYFLWWQLRLPDGRSGWAVDVPGWWEVVSG